MLGWSNYCWTEFLRKANVCQPCVSRPSDSVCLWSSPFETSWLLIVLTPNGIRRYWTINNLLKFMPYGLLLHVLANVLMLWQDFFWRGVYFVLSKEFSFVSCLRYFFQFVWSLKRVVIFSCCHKMFLFTSLTTAFINLFFYLQT